MKMTDMKKAKEDERSEGRGKKKKKKKKMEGVTSAYLTNQVINQSTNQSIGNQEESMNIHT